MNPNVQVRQISQAEVDAARGVKSQMSQEELQRTQVLNLQDVEEIANYEKRTSKKPAIILAIIGLLFISSGGTLSIIQKMDAKPVKNTAPATSEVQKKVESKPAMTNLSCVYISANNGDGTSNEFIINYNFSDGELVSFTKKNVINQLPNEPAGLQTIQGYINGYKPYTVDIPGYSVVITTNNTTQLTSLTTVDLEKLDMTKYPQFNQSHVTTSIEYQIGTEYETLKTNMIEQGYTCQ